MEAHSMWSSNKDDGEKPQKQVVLKGQLTPDAFRNQATWRNYLNKNGYEAIK